jgi:hypothetical protein
MLYNDDASAKPAADRPAIVAKLPAPADPAAAARDWTNAVEFKIRPPAGTVTFGIVASKNTIPQNIHLLNNEFHITKIWMKSEANEKNYLRCTFSTLKIILLKFNEGVRQI